MRLIDFSNHAYCPNHSPSIAGCAGRADNIKIENLPTFNVIALLPDEAPDAITFI